MTDSLSSEHVTRALKKAAQLRALFQKLPHVPTPAETRLLEDFDAFVGGAEACSTAAARAGFRARWRRWDYAVIVAAAVRLGDQTQNDRELATFADLAARALARLQSTSALPLDD